MRPYHLIGLLLILLVASFSAAQDAELTETYTFKEGASFDYPADWTLSEDGRVAVTSDHTRILVMDDASLRHLGTHISSGLVDTLNIYVIDQYPDHVFQRSKVLERFVGSREADRYPFTLTNGNEALLIAMRFSDLNIALLDIQSLDGKLTEQDIALDIADSFDRLSHGHQPVANNAVEPVATAAPAADCTVSTNYADSVRVRVGPGSNRTSFAFLPAETEFKVMGKAQASDDTIWWKLDKQEVAPKKSAAEAWVSELDVEESGSCDAVVDVNAPPLIPIAAAPPAGSNPGGNNAGTGSGIVPGAGNWTIVYAPTAPVSCLDRPGLTVQVPIDIPPDSVSISQPGGSTLIFDGDTFSSIQPGVYQGLYNSLLSASNVVLTLRVVSDSVMTVEFIYNDTIEGTACSFTINGTATHN